MPQMAGGNLFLMMSHKLTTYSTFKLRRSLYDRKVSEANGERTTSINSWAESSPDSNFCKQIIMPFQSAHAEGFSK